MVSRSPFLRGTRRPSFADDAARDVSYALRTFRRAPLAAATIVATVALGLGLVAAAFTLLSALLFNADAVPDVREMFAVERTRTSDGQRQRFTRADLDALRRDTAVFADAYAEVAEVDSLVEGRVLFGTFVSGGFSQALRVAAARGRPLTPADDDPLEGRAVMVLSHRGWDRLFARDPAVLGRRLLVNGTTFEIVGVMPERFRGLATVAPDDYWAPLSTLARVRPGQDGAQAVEIVGRLRPGVTREAAIAQLAAWDAVRPGADQGRRDQTRITLVPRRGTVPQPLEVVPITAPLFFAFGLVLLIGCANVANLLLARAVARQREMGIRLSLGATRRRIVRQLLTESLLLALVAAAAGYAISRLVLEVTISRVMATMPPDIGDVRLLVPDSDWRVLVFLVVAAGASTVLFALAPALQATRIDAFGSIRGVVARDGRPGRARTLLIGLQVSASALLLIAAAVFLRSAFTASRFDPGVRTSDTLVVQIPDEARRDAIVDAVAAEPAIAAVAAAWPDLSPRPAFVESGGSRARAAYRLVSPEYFTVLDVPVLRGRTFTPDERTPDAAVAVVSETAARTLWPDGDAIGQVLRLETGTSSEPGQPPATGPVPGRIGNLVVAGIVRDIAGFRMAPFDKTVVYVPASAATPGTSLLARAHGDPEQARQALLTRLTPIDANVGRRVLTLRTMAGMETYFLGIAFWLTVVLGGLALALTASGLFSVLSYVVEQRTREIGVRLALGATPGDVTRLVLAQTIRPVGIGLIAGGGAAAGIAVLLLASPAAAGIGAIVRVLDPLAYAASLLVIVAACLAAAAFPAGRAARVEPWRTLRED